MTTDRELLELAAKAAGYPVDPEYNGTGLWVRLPGFITHVPWHPFTDDGDALRLAVQLDLTINSASIGTMATLPTPIGDCAGHIEMIDEIGDKFAATRRAIVRAAAAIGESKCRT
jgi:hypothetical protein